MWNKSLFLVHLIKWKCINCDNLLLIECQSTCYEKAEKLPQKWHQYLSFRSEKRRFVQIHSLRKCKQENKLGKKQKLLLFKRTKLAKINWNYFCENFKFRKNCMHRADWNRWLLKIKSTADCQSLLCSIKITYILTNFVTKTIYLKNLFPVTTSDNESIYSSSVQA